MTGAPGLADADADMLKEYVSNLTGGEGAEQSVEWLDAQARKGAQSVLSSLSASLAGGVAVGVVATILGALAAVAGAAEAAGAALASGLLAGGSVAYFIVRSLHAAAQAGEAGWARSWTWATNLGTQADDALSDVRRRQQAVWLAVTGAPWRFQAFTSRARLRAQLLVGVTWALVIAGGLLVLLGAFEALNDAATPTYTTPTYTFSTTP